VWVLQLMLTNVWGSVFVKIEIDIGPKTLFGIEFTAGGTEEAVPSVDVFLGLGEKN